MNWVTVRNAAVLTAGLLLCLVAGCFEEELEVTLNSDGSGSVKHKITLSERLVVAASDENGQEISATLTDAELRDLAEDSLEIEKLKSTDLPDGRRVIEMEATFRSAEEFFASEYCAESANLRLSQNPAGNLVVVCDMQQEKDNISLNQFYGLAKGLHIRRTVRFPAPVDTANGILSEDRRSVTWALDLRDKAGLAKAREFLEGAAEGKGRATIAAADFQFSLPENVEPAQEPAEEVSDQDRPESAGASGDGAGLKLLVSELVHEKVKVLHGEGMTAPRIVIVLKLQWEPGKRPVSCFSPVLTSLFDDQDNDLVADSFGFEHERKIHDHEKEKTLRAYAKAPGDGARLLRNLQGHVEVVAAATTEQVKLKNPAELVGKPRTEHELLDRSHFKIESLEGTSLKVSIDGDYRDIASVHMLGADGSKIEPTGWFGSGGRCSFNFAEDISKSQECVLEIVTGEDRIEVPFSAEELELP